MERVTAEYRSRSLISFQPRLAMAFPLTSFTVIPRTIAKESPLFTRRRLNVHCGISVPPPRGYVR